MSDKEVAVLGVGLHKFGRFPEKSIGLMGAEAGLMALEDAGMSPKDIECGFAAHVYLPMVTGANVFTAMGITRIPVTNVELACASSSRAIWLGIQGILSGEFDTCLVVGIEKLDKGLLRLSGMDRASIAHEGLLGLTTAPAYYALRATMHMAKYGTKAEHFGYASVIAHRNAALNPNAHFQQEMSLDAVMNSEMMAYPITLYMCSGTSQGASAVVLCSKEKARQYTTNPVYITGWSAMSPVHVKGQWDNDWMDCPLEDMAHKAFERAGIGPEDIDVAQIHDAFSPGICLEIEELGFCPKGEGGPFVWEGNTEISGRIPINTDGGLVGRGHPLGATGAAMTAELVKQLRGTAGPRQVKNPKTALQHNGGGGGGNIFILKR